MKAIELINAILIINISCREKGEGKREYFENQVKTVFFDFMVNELKSLDRKMIERYLFDAELTIKESSLKEIIKENWTSLI